MKKLIILFTILIGLSSCNYSILNADKVISTIIKESKAKRTHLITIKNLPDSLRINYIDSVLKADEQSFYEVKGAIQAKKDYWYTLELTTNELDNYLKQ